MNQNRIDNAIKAALNGKWDSARITNEKLLADDPKDIDSLNRLARAYIELRLISKARQTAKKVLELEPSNPIALRSISNWKGLKKSDMHTLPARPSNATFLEIPGKTKTLSLIHLGSDLVKKSLIAGEKIQIKTHGRRISICTENDKYIGRLPDDISGHLKNLIQQGKKYEGFIKSTSRNEIKVFLRETKSTDSSKSIQSFTIISDQSVKI